MKKTAFLLFFCITTFTTSFSQTKQASINELIHVMKNDSMMNKMIDAMIPTMTNQLFSELKDSTAKARSAEMMKIAMETAKELAPKMNVLMTSFYDKYFTESEINDFLTFYKSPTGRKSISIMPQMMNDMMGEMMKNYIPEMKKTMKARMDEYIKKEKK
jgi:hypothetical protein